MQKMSSTLSYLCVLEAKALHFKPRHHLWLHRTNSLYSDNKVCETTAGWDSLDYIYEVANEWMHEKPQATTEYVLE